MATDAPVLLAPGQPCSQLKGAPVHWICPQVPGRVMFAGLAWAVCQHQDQTEICCSTSQLLPWRLATPQRPVCEGRKEAGLFSLPVRQALSPQQLGWAGLGEDRVGREDTQQGLTQPNKASLMIRASSHRLRGQQLPDIGLLLLLLWLVGLLRRECSL